MHHAIVSITHGLSCCSCRNFALIEEQNVSFKPGLNVITGESGAGKSVLVEALGQVHNTQWNTLMLIFMLACTDAWMCGSTPATQSVQLLVLCIVCHETLPSLCSWLCKC